MDNEQSNIRFCSHAGSWYTSDPNKLDKEMSQWLKMSQETVSDISKVKGIIGPHAGFSYSGPVASWAYQYLKPTKDLKIFLLGPCHHVNLKSCGLSQLDYYETPLGNIQIDKQMVKELYDTKMFVYTDKETEEDEHSLEMHLPYIQKQLQSQEYKLIPIMVPSLSSSSEETFGKLLAQYFDRDDTVFIISSDFCHWGNNFDYYYYKKEDGNIYQSIENLDKLGISYIEKVDVLGFQQYLYETENTICGQHPISIYLNILKYSKYKQQLKTTLVRYAQSNHVKSKKESSVSYASIITYY